VPVTDIGAEEAFREYVSARFATLVRAAYLLTGDRHAAEDLVQAALIKVAGRWERLIARGNPDAYVRRVIYTQHVSAWRRRRAPAVSDRPVPDRAAPDFANALAISHAVRDAQARLGPRQRAVLVLRYFEDLSEAQVAEVLGCSVGTVKSQARDGLARLRQLAPELAALDDAPSDQPPRNDMRLIEAREVRR
jgi:RNA polymerase sigma-70 factor (sigma-E family)